ncbi:hypothetical protein N7539_003164 [Penicillium diatomitis]|uniref:Uncharacterized protein n=1 Tax=Penicillium diatomitis TaxID=2819901 RepID=A0A9W9XG84_9EURO|nr:uncharacterized protein N7539_003164 [Penicillium diatomitis]KAJ5491597.1 hypothetical protein N7539_003164 [Penicillium diatomitis]
MILPARGGLTARVAISLVPTSLYIHGVYRIHEIDIIHKADMLMARLAIILANRAIGVGTLLSSGVALWMTKVC